jgi:hypothetical protein
MSDKESRCFEVQVRVSAAGQPDAVVNREYVTSDAASTDKAARTIFDAIHADERAKMRPVADGG